jgi:hypothetical protein
MRLKDITFLLGFALLVAGCWLVAPALALIVAGSLMMALGLAAHIYGGRRPPNDPNSQSWGNR